MTVTCLFRTELLAKRTVSSPVPAKKPGKRVRRKRGLRREKSKYFGTWCDRCKKSFSAAYDREVHMRNAHCVEPEKLPCNHSGCKEFFTLPIALERHKEEHLTTRCQPCQIDFSRPYALQRHQAKRQTTKGLDNMCYREGCYSNGEGTSFPSLEAFKEHTEAWHISRNENVLCLRCRSTLRGDGLKTHWKTKKCRAIAKQRGFNLEDAQSYVFDVTGSELETPRPLQSIAPRPALDPTTTAGSSLDPELAAVGSNESAVQQNAGGYYDITYDR